MDKDPPILSYEAKPPSSRRWGLSGPVWLLVAGFCIFTELAAWFATNGRINGLGDTVFVIGLALVAAIALISGVRRIA